MQGDRSKCRKTASSADVAAARESATSLLQLGANVSAVARIAAALRGNPELDIHNRVQLKRASDESVQPLVRMHYLDLLKLSEDCAWEFLDPSRLVARRVGECPTLAKAFADAASRHPCNASRPHIMLAWDEFTAGSVLPQWNARKMMVLSLSFLELGKE